MPLALGETTIRFKHVAWLAGGRKYRAWPVCENMAATCLKDLVRALLGMQKMEKMNAF